MAFDPVEALRAAGVIGGSIPEDQEVFYRNLTQAETDVLISLKDRLGTLLPEVAAHSAEWLSPEAAQVGMDTVTSCFCGAWSGSGSGAN